MTNFEKIKEMSVEEFAELILSLGDDSGYYCFVVVGTGSGYAFYEKEKALKEQIEWLESEAEE